MAFFFANSFATIQSEVEEQLIDVKTGALR